MELTKTNFKSQIADIKAAITNADFVTIDSEFSGLNVDSDSNINPYDNYEQYYNKLKRNITKFLVLQYGLCTFRYDEKDKKYKQKCYNFYIFPRSIHRTIPDVRFTCQASSLEFLSNHDFNFNKVFKEGITYLNQSDESKYRQYLNDQKEKVNINNDPGIIPVPKDDKPFVDQTMEIIKKFLSSGQNELMLPQCNAFRRRLIYQTTREMYGNLVNLETRTQENKDRILYVTKPETPEEKSRKEQEKYEASLSELEDAVGFSRIIQFLSESRKLVIGHNLCLDLLHMVDKFLTPLPSYSEFKECVSCLFPKIIDTKYMASSTPFKDIVSNTVLGGMVKILTKEPFEVPEIEIEEDGEGYTLENDKEHESGFDAYLTGLSFLSMVKYLDKKNYHKILQQENVKILKPYLNKICVQRLQDCLYMNLSGNDSKLNRDHVLHVSFPKDWKLNELNQLFSPYGYFELPIVRFCFGSGTLALTESSHCHCRSNIHVAWLNDTSAYVALYKKEHALQALKNLSKSSACIITSYSSYQAKLNTQKRESDAVAHVPVKKPRRDANFGDILKQYCVKNHRNLVIKT